MMLTSLTPDGGHMVISRALSVVLKLARFDVRCHDSWASEGPMDRQPIKFDAFQRSLGQPDIKVVSTT